MRGTTTPRLITLAAVWSLVPIAAAPFAVAEPPPPPDSAAVASGAPGVTTTPDGWNLTVAASNETQRPVAPLTTATSSREYEVGGTFTGTVRGAGTSKRTGGTLEAGYQIGCGIALEKIQLAAGGFGIQAGFGATGLNSIQVQAGGSIEIELRSGTVTTVSVDKKEFKAGDPRVTITNQHIKVDSCVGQSFIRSFATLTSSSDNNDDVVSYVGTTLAI